MLRADDKVRPEYVIATPDQHPALTSNVSDVQTSLLVSGFDYRPTLTSNVVTTFAQTIRRLMDRHVGSEGALQATTLLVSVGP